MIQWYGQLYIDDVLKKKKAKIMKKLEDGKVTFDIYCVALASNRENLFDIINTNELLFNYYKSKDIFVLGLAANKKSAVDLAVCMIKEVYKSTGDFDVRQYYDVKKQTG